MSQCVQVVSVAFHLLNLRNWQDIATPRNLRTGKEANRSCSLCRNPHQHCHGRVECLRSTHHCPEIRRSLRTSSRYAEIHRSPPLNRVDKTFDIEAIITQLKSKLPPTTRILHTSIPLIAFPSASGQHRTPQPFLSDDSEKNNSPSELDTSPENSFIVYIGAESLTLTNLLLTHASYEVIYSYLYDRR